MHEQDQFGTACDYEAGGVRALHCRYHSATSLRRISRFQSGSWMGQARMSSKPVSAGSSVAEVGAPAFVAALPGVLFAGK